MCDFDASTIRCKRCGYAAKKLPTYRECRTLVELAHKIADERMSRRIVIPPIPIGTAISRGLSAVGVTPERVKQVTGKDCGCQKRKNALDTAGAFISAVVERAANAALQVVLPSHVDTSDVAAIASSLQASPLTNAGLKSAVENKIDH